MPLMTNFELSGKRVVSQDGRVIGEIESLHIDVESWRVAFIGVKVRKDVLDELRLKRPFIGTQVIRIAADQISGASDTVVLKPPFSGLTYEGGEGREEAEPGSPETPGEPVVREEIRLGLFDDAADRDDDKNR
jgi:sporulation protein YlmC with PRC-barrel domain